MTVETAPAPEVTLKSADQAIRIETSPVLEVVQNQQRLAELLFHTMAVYMDTSTITSSDTQILQPRYTEKPSRYTHNPPLMIKTRRNLNDEELPDIQLAVSKFVSVGRSITVSSHQLEDALDMVIDGQPIPVRNNLIVLDLLPPSPRREPEPSDLDHQYTEVFKHHRKPDSEDPHSAAFLADKVIGNLELDILDDLNHVDTFGSMVLKRVKATSGLDTAVDFVRGNMLGVGRKIAGLQTIFKSISKSRDNATHSAGAQIPITSDRRIDLSRIGVYN